MSQEFHVSYSGFIRDYLKRLLREAAQHDSEFGQRAVTAVRRIDQRLRGNLLSLVSQGITSKTSAFKSVWPQSPLSL